MSQKFTYFEGNYQTDGFFGDEGYAVTAKLVRRITLNMPTFSYSTIAGYITAGEVTNVGNSLPSRTKASSVGARLRSMFPKQHLVAFVDVNTPLTDVRTPVENSNKTRVFFGIAATAP